MDKLNNKLRPPDGSSVSRQLKKLAKSMIWTLEKKGVERILSHIERVKTLVSPTLQNDHFNLSLRIKQDITEMKDDLETAARGITSAHLKTQDAEKQRVLF